MSYPPHDQGSQPPPYQQPQPYQQPPAYQPGYPQAPPPQDHPKAMLALILGIVGAVVCAICAPFAWVIGKRAVAEIDASGGTLGGRTQAQVGYILGLIWTILLILSLVLGLIFLIIAIAGAASSAA